MSKPARRILTINAGFSNLRFAIEGCGTLRLCTGGAFHSLRRTPGDTPQDAKWLDRPCRLYAAHVLGLPTELIEDPRNGALRGRVVPADKHRWAHTAEVRMDHARVTDGVECLTTLAFGICLCSPSMSDWSEPVKNLSTPFCGGPPIGLVASITTFLRLARRTPRVPW
jgi:hypothetical protein